MAETSRKLHTRLKVGRLWIDALTFVQALDEIERLVAEKMGGGVYTPNIDHVVNVDDNKTFEEAYQRASLSLVDGQPLVWASRLLGAPLPEKISGSDPIMPLLERAAARRWRVYVLGGGPGVAQEAAAKVRERLDVQFVGTESPVISLRPEPAVDGPIAERIRAARADVVLVALGSPKQELFIDRIADQIRPAVAIAVGAAVDFVAGRVRRAPRWMSRSGLEWLYRLGQEPRRMWRRYLVNDPRFLFILYRTMRTPRAERVASPR